MGPPAGARRVSGLALWTRAAIVVLVVLPPVIFVLFLRDAVRLMREIGDRAPHEETGADGDSSAGG